MQDNEPGYVPAEQTRWRQLLRQALRLTALLLYGLLYYVLLSCLPEALRANHDGIITPIMYFVVCVVAFFGLFCLVRFLPVPGRRPLCIASATGMVVGIARATYTYQFSSEELALLVGRIDPYLGILLTCYSPAPLFCFTLAIAGALWLLLCAFPPRTSFSPQGILAWVAVLFSAFTVWPDIFASAWYPQYYVVFTCLVAPLCLAGIARAVLRQSRALLILSSYCLVSTLFLLALRIFYLAMLNGAHPVIWGFTPRFLP